MKTSIFVRSARWMLAAAALGTANATPEPGPEGDSETADFISMDVQADQKMVGCKIEVSVENGIATLSGTACPSSNPSAPPREPWPLPMCARW